MNKTLLIAFLAIILNSCSQAQYESYQTRLSAAEFSKEINRSPNAVIVDVRTAAEFEKGHIEHAVNMDWNGAGFTTGMARLDKAAPVFVYCLSGGRSSSAAKEMRKRGFEHVVEMAGGILEWRANNLPEAKGNTSEAEMSIAQYEALLNTDKLVLIDFYADWCAPCKKMEPYLQNISREMGGTVTVIRIPADKAQSLCSHLKITSLPFLKLYKNKTLAWEKEGFIDEKGIRQMIDKYK